MRRVAFLRGINVGGKHTVPMRDLKPWLEGLGFSAVKTLLNSGNVIFDAPRRSPLQLEALLARQLEEWLGFEVATMVRTVDELAALLPHRPQLPEDVKTYVAFARGTPARVTLPLSHEPSGLFVDAVVGRDLLVRVLPVKGRYAYSMDFIEKAIATQVTVRNWNTVDKALAAARD